MTSIEVLIVMGLIVAGLLIVAFAVTLGLCIWAVTRALRSPGSVGRRRP